MPLQLSLQIKNKIEELLFLYNFFRYNSGHFTKFNFANDILSIFNLVKYSFAHISIRNVRLEASSVCQLRCPACTTGNRRNKEGVIGWGILKFTDFKKFIDNNPSVKNIELSNYGEIFLNRDLKNIIKYAYEKGVFLSAGNGVNLNNISEEIIECLVKYKFKHLLVSIDGASNDTYKIYRIGGDFDRVIENIKRINYYKEKYHSKYPKLSWQFVIFGHNEHELPLAKKMAEELGMEFLPKLNHTPSYSPIKDEKFVGDYLKIGKNVKFDVNYQNANFKPCGQLWFSPQINWDGKLLGCCVNRYGDFGNVFEKGLKKALKGEKYRYAKKMVLGKVKPREDIPCYNCKYFNNIKNRNNSIKNDIII